MIPPLVSIPSQITPFHVLPSYFLKINFNILLPSMSSSYKQLRLGVSIKNIYGDNVTVVVFKLPTTHFTQSDRLHNHEISWCLASFYISAFLC
jgi:hypothetical protein